MNLILTSQQLVVAPFVTAAIVGIVEFIKQYVPQVNGGVTIILSALIGGIIGLFHISGIDPATGIVLGLTAVGVHQVATAAGGK